MESTFEEVFCKVLFANKSLSLNNLYKVFLYKQIFFSNYLFKEEYKDLDRESLFKYCKYRWLQIKENL